MFGGEENDEEQGESNNNNENENEDEDDDDEDQEPDTPEDKMDGACICLLVFSQMLGSLSTLSLLPSNPSNPEQGLMEEGEVASFVHLLLRIIKEEKNRRYSTAISTLLALNYPYASVLLPSENPVLHVVLDRKALCSNEVLEGVFVELNEYSYPSHEMAEAKYARQFVSDLLDSPESAGYFFPQDIRVLIDIVMVNMTAIGMNDSVLVSFLEILHKVLVNSEWFFNEAYRKSEIASFLETAMDGGLEVHEDVMAEVMEILAECVDMLE
jgi:hypothetical protein